MQLLNSLKESKYIFILFTIAYSYMFIRPIWTFLYVYEIIPIYNFNIILFPLLFILTIILLSNIKTNISVNIYLFLGTYLLIFISLIQILSLPWVLSYSTESLDYYTSTIHSTILMSILMWLVGVNYKKIDNLILNSKRIRKVIVLSYILFILCILYGILLNSKNLTTLLSLQVYDLKGQYLSISDTYAIISILLSRYIKKLPYYIFFHIFSIFMLLTLISRSSFIFYAITSIMMIIIKTIISDKKSTFVILFIIVLLAIFLDSNNTIINSIQNSNNRIVYTLLNKEILDDSSFYARQMLLENGLKNIKENWFLGEFMWYVDYYKENGTYIHNWLSFYENYGLIPFLIFILLSISLFIKVLVSVMFHHSNLSLMVFGMLIFTILSIIFTKSFIYVDIWLALGIATNNFHQDICKGRYEISFIKQEPFADIKSLKP